MRFLQFAFAGAWTSQLYRGNTIQTYHDNSLSGVANFGLGIHRCAANDESTQPYSLSCQPYSLSKCDVPIERNGSISQHIFGSFSFFNWIKDKFFSRTGSEVERVQGLHQAASNSSQTCEPVALVDCGAPVVSNLTGLWGPLFLQGDVYKRRSGLNALKLFRGLSLAEIGVAELKTVAKTISPTVSGYYKIDAFLLSESALDQIGQAIDVTSLAPDQLVTLKGRELAIITPECNNSHSYNSDTKEKGQGTVEVILNSAYTGGELQVMCDGQVTNLKTGPYDWVAVHADASCSISPVTSGARVSLIYDIVPITEIKRLVLQGEINWDIISYREELMDGLDVYSLDMNKIVDIAERLNPEQARETTLRMDPYFLNAKMVAKLPTIADLTGLFPHKNLVFRPRDVLIHKKTAKSDACTYTSEDRKKGYLGTLVIVLGSFFCGGEVNLSCRKESIAIKGERATWYAYGAGTTHRMQTVSYGTRISFHYDIFDAKVVGKVHDPFDCTDVTTVTRSLISPTLAKQVLRAVEAELSDAEAVVFALQHLYPDTVQLETLRGGDKALLSIFASEMGARITPSYDLQLVNISLHYQYNRASQNQEKNILVNSTVSYTSSDYKSSVARDSYAKNNTKLILATKLTEELRLSDNKAPHYRMLGLRVSKKKRHFM